MSGGIPDFDREAGQAAQAGHAIADKAGLSESERELCEDISINILKADFAACQNEWRLGASQSPRVDLGDRHRHGLGHAAGGHQTVGRLLKHLNQPHCGQGA